MNKLAISETDHPNRLEKKYDYYDMAEAWAAGIKYSLDITDGKRPAPTIPHQAHEEFDRFLDKLEVSTSEKEPQPGQQADDGGVGLEEGSHGGSGVDVDGHEDTTE